jgi:hypothetical protein
VLNNILNAARHRPLVIQSLWFRIHDAVPPDGEIEAYCGRLNRLVSDGGQLEKIQLYTIARDPADSHASPLTRKKLDRIASIVRSRVAVPVEVFHS